MHILQYSKLEQNKKLIVLNPETEAAMQIVRAIKYDSPATTDDSVL